MLNNPDINPSASMNQWIFAILMFHFTLVHIPGSHHTPNGLSRRQPQPGDKEEPEDDFEDWINNVNGFLHFINPHPSYNKLITTYIHSYSNTIVEEQLAKQKEDTKQYNTIFHYSLRRASNCIGLQTRRIQEVVRNPQETPKFIKRKIQNLYVLLCSICINHKPTMAQGHKDASPTQDGCTLQWAFIFNLISS